MTVALVAGLVGGGAFAYFHDVETSTGNTFTAGTIDIDVSDDGGLNFENPWVRIGKVIGADMKPCEKVWDIIVVHNEGNNTALVWKHLAFGEYIEKENVYPVGNAVASSEPEYEAEGGPNTHSPIVDIDSKIDYSLIIAKKDDGSWGDTVADFDTATGIPNAADAGVNDLYVVAQGTVNLNDVFCTWYGPWLLAPSDIMIIAQDYHLQEDTGNEYQGDGVKFDVEFYAEQLGGPGK